MIDCDAIDLGGIQWSPSGFKIAIWDGVHSGKLFIFSIDGLKIAEVDVFGIHNIEWSPSAQIIPVASVRSKV